MYSYDPLNENHGLRYDPIKALVMPRPIGWVSTMCSTGKLNLAPYSFFNLVNTSPYQVMMASAGEKDSLKNIEDTGEMVFNGVSLPQLVAMNTTSSLTTENEFELAKLSTLPAVQVKPPRVANAPWHLECRLDQIIELRSPPQKRHAMVIATIVQVHIVEDALRDGKVDQVQLQTVARCGYRDYTVIDSLFELERPLT